jgi:hypothetical protein
MRPIIGELIISQTLNMLIKKFQTINVYGFIKVSLTSLCFIKDKLTYLWSN